MLITRQEVKDRLNITDTTKDDFIDAMILDLRDWLTEYLANPFINPNLYYTSDTISFDGKTISDSDSQFVIEGFVDDMDIFIFGSSNNDGHYTIKDVLAGSMDAVNEVFTYEEAGEFSPKIYQVQFPSGLKSIVANMIKWQMNQFTSQNISSEKIGNYSVSYTDGSSFDTSYPKSIIKSLQVYRKLSQ